MVQQVTKALSKKKSSLQPKDLTYHLKFNKKYLKFFHENKQKKSIKMALTHDLAKEWIVLEKAILKSRQGYFDQSPLNILNVFKIEEGIVLFYFVTQPSFAVGAALFDKTNPELLLWRSANPIFSSQESVEFQKITKQKREITLNLKVKNKIQKIKFSLNDLFGSLKKKKKKSHDSVKGASAILQRSQENPVIQPRLEQYWENNATFNSAAVYLAGKVHFIYRAVGSSGMSVLGYAASRDGIHIDERLSQPIYLPTAPFEFRRDNNHFATFNYLSGGGWGGCEDPRLTRIDDTLYMTYTAFNGAEPPGVALTSIKVEDFLNKEWYWKRPVLISPRGQIHKNWVIFPEKIKGQYAILHSISPEIAIDYFDSLNFGDNICIQSYYRPSERNGCWDNQVRGAGPPPIKTKLGWLLIYHAMDKHDPNKYKLGAMILDEEDPAKILYRASWPILEPKASYENYGYKGGVIYSCGAVVINDQLFVYYGGADTVTCVATGNLSELLQQIKKGTNYKR